MHWVVLEIAIIAGLLLGTIGLKRAGFAISFGLFMRTMVLGRSLPIESRMRKCCLRLQSREDVLSAD